MPELPEVETVARGLQQHVAGRTIISIRIAWDKTVQAPTVSEFVSGLTGRTVIRAGRRGKYLLLQLDDGASLSIHLRMTGRLFILPAGSDVGTHTRIVWTLDDGHELHFVDPRKFGRVALLRTPDLAALDHKLGPEPLTGLAVEELAQKLRRRKIAIKSALLDQSVLAGVGNIYADEALFRARINPRRPANSLSPQELGCLCEAILQVLSSAVERHGTTLRDEQFRGLEGRMGENQGYLEVFRRTGQPCPVCGAPVERIRLGGRSTHFCPHCQPLG